MWGAWIDKRWKHNCKSKLGHELLNTLYLAMCKQRCLSQLCFLSPQREQWIMLLTSSMASVFTYMSWSHVDKYLKKHVGQITQPRVPERNHFPTTIICRKNAYDENKVIQSGLPKDFYSRFSLPENLSTDFPDLNTKWNDVTMGIGHTLRGVAYRDHL